MIREVFPRNWLKNATPPSEALPSSPFELQHHVRGRDLETLRAYDPLPDAASAQSAGRRSANNAKDEPRRWPERSPTLCGSPGLVSCSRSTASASYRLAC